MHLNRVTLIGNVVKDPEIRYAGAAQTPVSDVRIACNRTWKTQKGEKREEHLFIDVVAWARSAELAVQYLKKGRLVGVDGRLQMDEWQGTDGKRNSRIKIVADRIVFLPQGQGAHEGAPAVEVSAEGASHEEEEARVPA